MVVASDGGGPKRLLPVGAIGDVATLPEHRKRGLAAAVLQRTFELMETSNVGISVLHSSMVSATLLTTFRSTFCAASGSNHILSPAADSQTPAPSGLRASRRRWSAAGRTGGWAATVCHHHHHHAPTHSVPALLTCRPW